MSQTTLSVVLEVLPASSGRLSGIIEKVKYDEEHPVPPAPSYSRLMSGVPALHFMSMSVFEGADYDPLFVIEANFDGEPGPFWAQMEATLGDDLRAMLRCCKRPLDSDGALYDAVTAAGSRYPIAPYLEHRTLHPSVFHHGNRGLSRSRILCDGELFLATRRALGQPDPNLPNPYRAIKKAEDIHRKLRAELQPQFPWLDEPAAARIPLRERAADFFRLFAYLIVVLFALSLPGLFFVVYLRAFFPEAARWFTDLDAGPLLSLLIAPVLAALVLLETRAARPGEAAPSRAGGLSPSLQNAPTSLANPITLLLVVLVGIGLLTVAMAAVATAAKSVSDVLLAPPLAAMAKTYALTEPAGRVTAVLQSVVAFIYALPDGYTSFLPRWVDAFRQNWRDLLFLTIIGVYTVFVVSIPLLAVWLLWLELRAAHHDAPSI